MLTHDQGFKQIDILSLFEVINRDPFYALTISVEINITLGGNVSGPRD